VLLQAGLLRGLDAAAFLEVGLRGDGEAVLVVQQLLPQDAFEQGLPLLYELLAQGLQRGVEAETLERVLAVVPVRHRREHQREAPREAAGVELPVHEFDPVECGLDGLLLKALRGHLLQGFRDQLFHCGYVGLLDVLQTHGERGLREALVEAPADDPGAQARIRQGLAQGRPRRSHEAVVHDAEGERSFEIRLVLGQHPADASHGLLGDVLVLAHGEGMFDAPRLRPQRLEWDLRGHLLALEVAKELVQQLETAGRRVVAVKPELSV